MRLYLSDLAPDSVFFGSNQPFVEEDAPSSITSACGGGGGAVPRHTHLCQRRELSLLLQTDTTSLEPTLRRPGLSLWYNVRPLGSLRAEVRLLV